MAYSKDLIDALLKEADIVTVISSFIPVTKKGRSYIALCPFHDDKNPSLNISREKQIFKCFVCNTGGNAITFVQKHLGISYPEAVRKVAEIVGFHDPRLESEDTKPYVDPEKQSLYDTINDLNQLYQYNLLTAEGKVAADYLSSRHIDAEQIRKYGLGYASPDGEKTIQYLEQKKHSLDQIKNIGIVSSRNLSDANAGRLIFPLCNPEGQVVGFSARKLTGSHDDSPKYVNSPDTKIFTKSLNLYNYHNVKNTARRDGYCYVLEGFMDVMALDKAGLKNAVALMGTSLSGEQIGLLRRLGAEIRLCLDGDAPGQRGMMKIILQLSQANLPFRLVCNPNDLRDPDDILQESGPEALREAMNHLVDAFSFQMNYYQNVEKLAKDEDKKKVMKYFLPYLRTVASAIDREDAIVKLSKATGYETETIRHLVQTIPSRDDSFEESDYQEEVMMERLHPENVMIGRLLHAEREMLYYMLESVDAVHYYEKNVNNFYYTVYNEIANYVVANVERTKNVVSLPSLIDDIASTADPDEEELIGKISEISGDNYHPPISDDALRTCANVIIEEKAKIYDQMTTKEEMKNKTSEEKGNILKQYAERRRRQLELEKKKN